MASVGLMLFYVVGLVAGCLITNCPRGGKRGLHSYMKKLAEEKMALANEVPLQCARCGAEGEGYCVGPSICCGPQLGCLFASQSIQNQCSGSVLPHSQNAPSCFMPDGYGVCSTDGVCCNTESCRIDPTCEVDPDHNVCNVWTESKNIAL
uniref:Arginine-vasopressin-like peptide n=1 Tax=Laodelphax striatellus TaxID=195883 RepID=A0A345BED2_LAOST|nr:arginine-vasopressin-like peptide [Laodelphax striatellus]